MCVCVCVWISGAVSLLQQMTSNSAWTCALEQVIFHHQTCGRADFLVFCDVRRGFCGPTGRIIVFVDPRYFTDM